MRSTINFTHWEFIIAVLAFAQTSNVVLLFISGTGNAASVVVGVIGMAFYSWMVLRATKRGKEIAAT